MSRKEITLVPFVHEYLSWSEIQTKRSLSRFFFSNHNMTLAGRKFERQRRINSLIIAAYGLIISPFPYSDFSSSFISLLPTSLWLVSLFASVLEQRDGPPTKSLSLALGLTYHSITKLLSLIRYSPLVFSPSLLLLDFSSFMITWFTLTNISDRFFVILYK